MGTLSVDLRQRIIARWDRGNITVDALADAFMVGRATVMRLIRRYRETGSVAPKPHAGGRKLLVGIRGERLLSRLVERNPDWTTHELTEAYNAWAKRSVSRSTVLRVLKRLGFTIKKSASSPWSEKPSASANGSHGSNESSEESPLRVWFLWTRPARTSR